MKSLLQEASSIIKAIEKAWSQAGRPDEFSIKVLEQGERNFFGFSKRPSIITILFDPQKMRRGGAQRSGGRPERGPDRLARVGGERPSGDRQRHPQARDQARDLRDRDARAPERGRQSFREMSQREKEFQRPQDQQLRHPTEARPAPAPQQRRSDEFADDGHPEWNNDMVGDVTSYIKEIVVGMGLPANFTTSVDHGLLSIVFASTLVDDRELERNIFASLSHLSLQMLKKKYKKKLRGYRVNLSCADSASA